MDCGSTSTRVIAVNHRGAFLAQAAFPSAPSAQKSAPPGLVVWDLDKIWRKLCRACRQVVQQIDPAEIKAVTVTTFGADGAPVDSRNRLTYPVISWQCRRTESLARDLPEIVNPRDLFRRTGYQIIYFNTLLKLIWLRQYAPDALDRADSFVMMPGLLSMKLTGEKSVDPTMASTTMAFDLARNAWSEDLLQLAGLDPSFFPRWVEPGDVIGPLTRSASRQTGVPPGVPVVAAGHDTQFAPIGAGAAPGEAVLSTGTWEILLARVPEFRPTAFSFNNGVVFERDACRGLYNPQFLMMGSAVLEWVRKLLFPDLADSANPYRRMIRDAAKVPPGAGGLILIPSFLPGAGPTAPFDTLGTILGLRLQSSRAEIYRAALEGLSLQLNDALRILSRATGRSPRAIRVVGGGSKNDLWNQIRADVTGLPVIAARKTEATVLGAAMVAFVATGVLRSLSQGKKLMRLGEKRFRPSRNRDFYRDLGDVYRKLPRRLAPTYRNLIRFSESASAANDT